MTTYLRATLLIALLLAQSSTTAVAETCPVNAFKKPTSSNQHFHIKPESETLKDSDPTTVTIGQLFYKNKVIANCDSPTRDHPSVFSLFGMSTTDTISLLAALIGIAAWGIAVVACVIAYQQYKHAKTLEANRLTVEFWKQYQVDFARMRSALVTLNNPMNTNAAGFTNVEYFRNWIDGIATFGTQKGIINNAMVKTLGLHMPIKKFMTSLESAVNTLRAKVVSGEPRAPALLKKYEDLLNSSTVISEWLKLL